MAGNRKEYELLMKLTAALGSGFSSTFKTAMDTTSKLQDSLKNIQKVQKNIDGYEKTQNAIAATKSSVQALCQKHTELQQKLAATIAREKELQKALEQSKKSTGKETEEYIRLESALKKTQTEKEKLKTQVNNTSSAIARANKEIDNEEEKLSKLSTELKAAGVNTDKLSKENERLKETYDKVKKSQENIARINQKIDENKGAISKTRTELAKTVGVITGAGAAFYKGFIKPATDFQEQMSVVQAISGATTEDMTKLNGIAKKMGATTKFTAIESGQALEYMAMAGWDTNAMMNGLPGIMNLAAASGEDLASVSDILTDAMTAFNMGAGEADRFADVLAATATSSNTNVGIMGETFKNIAPLAGAMGYSIEDMSVAIGLMANAGVKGSNAGTSLKNIIANLADPSKEVTEAMKKLNLSLLNNDGTTKNFEEVVNSLRNSFSGLTESEKAAYAATIGGKQGMAGLLAVVNSADGDFANLTESINNCQGAAEQMAIMRNDNLNGDIILAKSAWDGLATTIGEMFLPELRGVVQGITDIINKANDFAQANPELIKTLAKVAGGLAAVKVGSLAGKLGFLEMKGGVLDIAKSFLGFKSNMAESVATAVTGGGKIATMGKGLGSVFGGLFGKAMSIIMIISALSLLFLKLSGQDVSAFINPLKEAFVTLKPVLNEVMGQFKSLGKQMLPLLLGAARELAPLLGNIVTAVLPIILELIQNISPLIIKLVKDLLPAILNIITSILPLITEIITSVLPIVLEILQLLLPIITQLVTSILPIVVDIINQIMPLITQLVEVALVVLMDILKDLMPVIMIVAEAIKGGLGAAIEAIKPIIDNVIKIFKGIIDFITGVFTGNWEQAWEGIKGIFGGIFGGLVELVKAPFRLIIGVVNGVIGGLNKIKLPDWIPGLGGKKINIPLIPTFEKGSNATPDTFIAGDVNGKGGELVTGARGRKVFTAAETNAIFDNINRAKAINNSVPSAVSYSDTPKIAGHMGGLVSALSGVAASRTNELTGQTLTPMPKSHSGGQTFTINYSPTIYVDGNKQGDFEEKLKQNNEEMLRMFKEFLRKKREDERRTIYA